MTGSADAIWRHTPVSGGQLASRFSDDLLCDAGSVDLSAFNNLAEPAGPS